MHVMHRVHWKVVLKVLCTFNTSCAEATRVNPDRFTSQAQSRFTFFHATDILISLSSALNSSVDPKDHWTEENEDRIELELGSFVHLIRSDPLSYQVWVRHSSGRVNAFTCFTLYDQLNWNQNCQWYQCAVGFHSVSYQKGTTKYVYTSCLVTCCQSKATSPWKRAGVDAPLPEKSQVRGVFIVFHL